MNTGGFFNMDAQLWEILDGPTEPAWYYETIPYPQVNGVSAATTRSSIRSREMTSTSAKKTKNLDAILKFFDYTLQPKPEQQQVVNEGPAGVFWDWVDGPLGKWEYTDTEYQTLHDSGDQAKKVSTTPELYMTSSYSNEWYPWWNYNLTEPKGRLKTIEFTEKIGKMGTIRVAEPHDRVKAKAGGLWEKYLPELDAVKTEYKAKLIMAKDDAAFEEAWNEFQAALEKRAHWSELKTEWHEQLNAEMQ
ncbi:hypothetical protein HMSSN139_02290 [Paenibacillus sp. HMSSN-139]|nr:hypothetical protein HMSSN139_02290 [Paenibacillus sp. HMSSN-139]